MSISALEMKNGKHIRTPLSYLSSRTYESPSEAKARVFRLALVAKIHTTMTADGIAPLRLRDYGMAPWALFIAHSPEQLDLLVWFKNTLRGSMSYLSAILANFGFAFHTFHEWKPEDKYCGNKAGAVRIGTVYWVLRCSFLNQEINTLQHLLR